MNQNDPGQQDSFWKPLAYSCAEDGGPVAFPHSEECIAGIRQTRRREPRHWSEDGGDRLLIRNSTRSFVIKRLLITFPETDIWWMAGMRSGTTVSVSGYKVSSSGGAAVCLSLPNHYQVWVLDGLLIFRSRLLTSLYLFESFVPRKHDPKVSVGSYSWDLVSVGKAFFDVPISLAPFDESSRNFQN